MQLIVGERLEGSGPEQQPGGYVITGVVSETPWSGLYTAKKVFYNFDFSAKRVRETDDKEWLDVFLRTIRYPILDEAEYVAQRRALARAEVRGILGKRHSNLWPEPIDLLEVEDPRDPFAFVADGPDGWEAEPIVVFARPHGEFLPAWLQHILPLASVLSVVAELLEFVRQAHDEDLLLLGLAPDVIVVDALERVHYVGTELALAQHSPLLTDSDGSERWARLFPPERFSRGFSAPECFRRGGRPDRRSDLYSWGCLIYLLLTGESPAQIAHAQGRPWPRFQPEHLARLDNVLAQFPSPLRAPWAEQLGLPAPLPADWPRSLGGVLRLVLSPDANQRPASVAELRRWLVNLPPPALAGLAALQVDPGSARLLLDCSALEANSTVRIRRGRGRAPTDPDEGEAIYDGPAMPVVIDDDLPLTLELTALYYTAWTIKDGTHSAGLAALLWQPTPQNVRRWAEEQAALGHDGDAEPASVAMVLGALDATEAAYDLLPSPSPRVRGWGLRRLEQALRNDLRFSLAEAALWQYLRDPSAGLRLSAALDVWTYAGTRDDELLLRLLEALETPPLDGAPPTAAFLAKLDLPEARMARVLQALDLRRPTSCPLCEQPIPAQERLAHLREAHSYVEYDGDAVPYGAAVSRLWERVLHRQDQAAHERLLELYLRHAPPGASDPPGLAGYVADLQKQVLGQDGAAPVALPFAAFEAYLALLRQSEPFMPLVRLMLLLGEERLRDLGREALVPALATKLRGEAVSGNDVWHALEEACLGADMIEERLRLCQRLPALGVDAAAVAACAARLHDERPVRCSECHLAIRSRDIETHLRRAHGLFEFRGVRRSDAETRAAVLRAVCSTPPDLRAWHNLRGLAEDRHPNSADRHLLGWLFQHVRALEPERRPVALVGVAEAVAASGSAAAILPVALGPQRSSSWAQIGRRLALELAARLPPPVPEPLVNEVKPLLSDSDLPRKGRQRAVMALLRTTGRDGPAAYALLRAFVAGRGKLRAIEKLNQLEQRFGQAPALDEVRRALQDEVRMSCPRCPTQLRKKDMVRHLWDRHRLVLDGERVREPWRVLEDWAVDYGLEKDPELLQRCQELARQVDPAEGLTRLYRLVLRRGSADREIVAALVEQAAARAASLCPHCYAFVAAGAPEPPEPLTLERRVLEGGGYRLVLGEVAGLIPTLRVDTPDELLYDGREPGRWLTPLGGFLLIPGISALLLFVLLYGLTGFRNAGLILLFAAGAALIIACVVYVLWPTPAPSATRLLRQAWERVIPELLSAALTRPARDFLHGLARLSARPGRYRPRRARLAECQETLATPASDDGHAALCLAELSWLEAVERRDDRRDAAGYLADELAECFEGRRSLHFLGQVLEELNADRKDWGRGALRRLQVRLAARAFEHGLTADDLLELGRVFPSARAVLGLDDRWRWGQLEQLWTLRRGRAWTRVGPAIDVFELADEPASERLLEDAPHLLLSVRDEDLHVTSRGVWLLGQYLAARPDEQTILWEWSTTEKAYVIEVGSHRLHTPDKPRDLVIALKAWLRFYFDDFLPRVPTARRPTSDAALKMWQSLRTSCPECGRALVPCLGDVGIALR